MASPDVLLRRLAQSVVAGVRDKAYAVRNGRISALNKADVGLSAVDNTSDAAKPVSTATQTALSNKVDKVAGKQLSTEDYRGLHDRGERQAGQPVAGGHVGAADPGRVRRAGDERPRHPVYRGGLSGAPQRCRQRTTGAVAGRQGVPGSYVSLATRRGG